MFVFFILPCTFVPYLASKNITAALHALQVITFSITHVHVLSSLSQEGKKCLNIYREQHHQNLTLSGCVSTKAYWPKYCGVCVATDDRCCIPYKSKTIEVEFRCPNGAVLSWKMMWINACFCNLSCRNPNDIFADLDQFYDHNEIINWGRHKLSTHVTGAEYWKKTVDVNGKPSREQERILFRPFSGLFAVNIYHEPSRNAAIFIHNPRGAGVI